MRSVIPSAQQPQCRKSLHGPSSSWACESEWPPANKAVSLVHDSPLSRRTLRNPTSHNYNNPPLPPSSLRPRSFPPPRIMATTDPQPLDEIQHRRPEIIQWWLSGPPGLPGPFLPMEARFVHRYFSESPFCDPQSLNALLFSQANNPESWALVHNREALEARLRTRPGIEHVIAEDPKVLADGQASGVYVLRKQRRLEERSEEDRRRGVYPRTETVGTHFVVGENVYQAPSVGDVVRNRLLNATRSLDEMLERGKGLDRFAPTTGHTYLPPTTAKPGGTTSTAGSPSRSRETSVAPGGAADAQSMRSGSVVPDQANADLKAGEDFLSTRLLADALTISLTYGDEYMDENPLLGEPGNFRFTSSTAAVKKRKADEEAAALAAQKAKEAAASRTATPKAPKAPTPPPVFSEVKTQASGKGRESREERKRRRKSRMGGTSSNAGTTPSTPKAGLPVSAGSAGGAG